MLFHLRTKSESPNSSQFSMASLKTNEGGSSQSLASHPVHQTTTTSYGFQLREDEGNTSIV